MASSISRPTNSSTLAALVLLALLAQPALADEPVPHPHVNRSPVDLVLADDGSWLATINQTAHTVSLVDTKSGRILDEVPCGERPVAIAMGHQPNTFLVSCERSGELIQYRRDGNRLVRQFTIDLPLEPYGIAVDPAGKAYVGLMATGQVAEIDLKSRKVIRRISVGAWPRYLTLSPDARRLAVGVSGTSEVAVIDTARGEVSYSEPLSGGINLGHMQTSDDGEYAYFTWMIYRINPITKQNIRRGWVLASRIGRVRLDGPSYREAISLDVPGLAVADPHGISITPNNERLVASASGTRELLVYRLSEMPFIGAGGPGDLIDRRLQNDRDLFFRVPLEGRPMGLKVAADSNTVYVTNYLRNSVQVVDLEQQRIRDEFHLGGSSEPSLARRGEDVFYDGRRSLDQWYSCHTCHYNGTTNSKAMDTWNDGTELTTKTVLPLYHLQKTRPWTWHGWQEDLADALQTSFTSTMQGPEAPKEDIEALLAFLETLEPAPSPFRKADGSLTEAAERGKAIFESDRANCASCHSGPHFTDGQIHDVGLGSPDDAYDGYNTPSLLGVRLKPRLLHDGRSLGLEDVLTGPHSPSKVSGTEDLSERELADVVEYLRSL